MDWALPTIAVSLLAYAAVSRRLDGTPMTGAMVFTAIGLVVGADALGLVDPNVTSEPVKLLAEATLALVLFGDASRIDLRALRDEVSIPARLLGIGLPLTIVAGFGVGLVLLGSLTWAEALLLAVDPRPDRRRARTGGRDAATPSLTRPPGTQRRERAQRRDLRAALLHRPRGRPGRGR